MRKMATIRKISKIESIEGAEFIEKAIVDGWQIVTKKGEFVPGDLVIYCEIDSFIPTEIAPYLTKDETPMEYKGIKGERLRTMKLRGCLSQGLLLNLGEFKDKIKETIIEGLDVSSYLGILKYEIEVLGCDNVLRRTFPAYLKSSDLERVQNINLDEYKDEDFEVTEKIDGSTCIFFQDEYGEFQVASGSDILIGDSYYNKIFNQIDFINKIKVLSKEEQRKYAFYGEVFGAKVSQNYYQKSELDFMLFNILNKETRLFLPLEERLLLCEKLGIKHIPVISKRMNISNMTVNDLLLFAEENSEIDKNKTREGLVFKSLSSSNQFKVVSNKYLLKKK